MIGRWIEMLFGGWRGSAWLAGLVLVLLLVPALVAADSYLLYLLFTWFLFAVFGHAWNLLAGFCGLLSFGNQVFIGIGGFALAMLFYYGRMNVWLALVLSGAAAALFAFLLAIPLRERRRRVWAAIGVAVTLWIAYEAAIAYEPRLDVFGDAYVRRVAILLLVFLGALPLLRLQGAYFAVATWLIAAAVASVFNEWKVVGAGGGMQIKTDTTLPTLYYAALLLLAASTATIWRLLRSRYGLALTAVRDEEEAAATVGIDIRGIKMIAFVLAGAFTGLAGGLYYIDAVIITPPAAFAVFWSAYFVFIVVAGGMGTLAGPIVGAAVYVIVDRLLTAFVGHGLLILGLASIAMMFLMPRGVLGFIHDLRSGSTRDRGEAMRKWLRLLLGVSERSSARRRADLPGVVAAYLVPGSPLPLMRRDNPPWQPFVAGYAAIRRAIADARPDAIVLYSTQWIAVLDQLWQTRRRINGLHVDENWHELGNLRFDIRIDCSLAGACIKAANEAGMRSRAVDYDGFPVDTGTIVAQNFINPDGAVPLVIAANNIYHDWETTRRLGELAAAQAIAQGKRVAVIGVGALSGTSFRDDRDFAADRVSRDSDDLWNRDVLQKMTEGRMEELAADLPSFCSQARADMGFKHFAFILGAIGGQFKGAEVHAYGPAYGMGAAIIEFRL